MKTHSGIEQKGSKQAHTDVTTKSEGWGTLDKQVYPYLCLETLVSRTVYVVVEMRLPLHSLIYLAVWFTAGGLLRKDYEVWLC